MRKHLPLFPLAAAFAFMAANTLVLLLSTPAHAGDRLLGTIVATTTKNNSDTATPFTVQAGARISVQCDAAAHVATATGTTCTATTSNVKVGADQLYDTSVTASGTTGCVAAVAVTGTANCRVYEREGNE